MQEHITITTPVYATYDEWHTCKSILPSQLQCIQPMMSDIHARVYHHHDSSICHPRWVTYMHNEWHVLTSTPHLQCMSPTTSDIHAREYYYHDSSIRHPWWVTYMQEDTTKPSIQVTHDEWHMCMRTPCLQCMPPMASNVHARAYYIHESSVCHPWRVTYMQENTIKLIVHATQGEWHAHISIP